MKCPACKSDLQGGLIFDTFMEKYGDESKAIEEASMYGATKTTGHWGREIGIETHDYDGTSFWKCPDCQAVWDRFTGKIKAVECYIQYAEDGECDE